MRKYEHDTSYYGGDILRTINRFVSTRPDIDRGGVYIWSVARKYNAFPLMIYLNLYENDYRGSLEFHCNGCFKSQINSDGILQLNEDGTDCVFDDKKIADFLSFYLWEDEQIL